jgi:hypothetical protein
MEFFEDYILTISELTSGRVYRWFLHNEPHKKHPLKDSKKNVQRRQTPKHDGERRLSLEFARLPWKQKTGHVHLCTTLTTKEKDS